MPEQMIASCVNVQEALYRILDSIKQLPSPPEVCLAVTQATQDDRATLTDIQTLVENDIALSGRLMQIANSAFFGVREPVTSVRRAIALLGFGTVRSLALGFFFNEEFGKLRLPGLPYPDLPRFALASSCMAETIAQTVAPELAADLACLGLLHESGVIVMAMAFGGQYRRMVAGMDLSDQELQQAETHMFGVNHVTASQLLLKVWKLSDPFVEAVAHHHQSDLAGADPTVVTIWQIIRLASSGALQFFTENDTDTENEAVGLAGRYFGWEPFEFGAVIQGAAAMYKDRTAILGLSPQAVDSDVSTALRNAAATGAPTLDGA